MVRLRPSVNHQVRVDERDAMPPQVALEFLVNPTGRLTNRFRKDCAAARWTYEVSTRTPKTVSENFARRTAGASMAQLLKWNRRCIARSRRLAKVIAAMQLVLEKAQTDYEKSIIEKGIGQMMVRKQILALALDKCVEQQNERCPQLTFSVRP